MGANLTDRVVIITGGSRGIGRSTAIAAAARGFRVCVGYASNEAAARSVVSTIEAKNGKAIAVKCDVGNESDILALFKAADKFGTLGALINNAGIVGPTSRVDEMSAERIQRVRARSGEADVDASWRPGWRHRQSVVGGLEARLAQYLCRLRGFQRRHRFLHDRTGTRGRRRGYSRCGDPARADRHRDSCLRRRARPRPPAQPHGADEACRHCG